MSAPTELLVELTETDELHREVNTGLMVRFINENLVTRAHLDVRKSVVIYDADKLFMVAVSVEDFNLRLSSPGGFEVLHQVGARYYSTGIV